MLSANLTNTSKRNFRRSYQYLEYFSTLLNSLSEFPPLAPIPEIIPLSLLKNSSAFLSRQ